VQPLAPIQPAEISEIILRLFQERLGPILPFVDHDRFLGNSSPFPRSEIAGSFPVIITEPPTAMVIPPLVLFIMVYSRYLASLSFLEQGSWISSKALPSGGDDFDHPLARALSPPKHGRLTSPTAHSYGKNSLSLFQSSSSNRYALIPRRSSSKRSPRSRVCRDGVRISFPLLSVDFRVFEVRQGPSQVEERIFEGFFFPYRRAFFRPASPAAEAGCVLRDPRRGFPRIKQATRLLFSFSRPSFNIAL